MTTHELAAALALGPNVPAIIVGGCATDSLVCDPGEVIIQENDDGRVLIIGWASNTNMEIR
jgi:hypothetical protein